MDPIRLDSGTVLRAPRVRRDGSVVFDAILARADALLRYPWGVEVALESTLSDPDYLEALRGAAVTWHHPPNATHRIDFDEERTDAIAHAAEVGRVLSARYDSTERAVVAELLITKAEAVRRIRAREMAEVSEGYRVPSQYLVQRADGVSEQRKRLPDHVAVTDRGRSDRPIIRTDSHPEGSDMTPEQIEGAIKRALAEQARTAADEAATKRADAAEAAKTAADARADAAEAKAAKVLGALGLRADATDADVEAAIAVRADEVAALRKRAGELNVALPKTGSAREIRRALAKGLPGANEARLDSDDYCAALIDAAQITSSTTRADSTTQPAFRV